MVFAKQKIICIHKRWTNQDMNSISSIHLSCAFRTYMDLCAWKWLWMYNMEFKRHNMIVLDGTYMYIMLHTHLYIGIPSSSPFVNISSNKNTEWSVLFVSFRCLWRSIFGQKLLHEANETWIHKPRVCCKGGVYLEGFEESTPCFSNDSDGSYQ